MRSLVVRSLLIVVILVFSGSISVAEDPSPGKQVSQTFQSKAGDKLSYLIALPGDYQSGKPAPLLLFLHGSGERGTDTALVLKHGPPRLAASGESLPFIVVSPQCPPMQTWKADLLLQLLDDLGSRYSVDPDAVYVTGLSMGGFGTWALLAADPDRFAAAVPICGHGDPWMADPASRVPVWIIVGDRDVKLLYGNCLGMADELRARGADVKLTIMHGVGHDSWSQTYATPELYEWMLRHRRKR